MIKLKILSGPFAGLEYHLGQGDTVLHLVRDVADTAAEAGAQLAAAENLLLVATDAECGRLVLRCDAHADGLAVAIAEQAQGDISAPEFVPAVLNAVSCHLGLYLAVAGAGEAWSTAVMAFQSPRVPTLSTDSLHPAGIRRQLRRWLPLALLLVSLAVAVAGGLAYYVNLPQVQAGRLADALAQSPFRYEVVAADDRTLHVFAEDDAAAAWAERAVRRADRWTAQVTVRSLERQRVEAWLLEQGFPPLIVRLQDVAVPEVVLSYLPSDATRERVARLAQRRMPYARQVKVSGISDAALAALARDELKTLGIATRTDLGGGRTSVSNTVFLDDATLAAMSAYSRAFEQRWGARRVTITTRLWDDVLRGRSFRYAPGQLMSVGQGRWEYSETLH